MSSSPLAKGSGKGAFEFRARIGEFCCKIDEYLTKKEKVGKGKHNHQQG